eukprot:6354154-Amphidinium_carterae.1
MSFSMSEEERDALGNWSDRVGCARSRSEPMAVRYSATRLEKSASTKRCLLAALASVASTGLPLTWDSMARLSTDKQRFEQDTLSEAWGRSILVSPLPSSMPEL